MDATWWYPTCPFLSSQARQWPQSSNFLVKFHLWTSPGNLFSFDFRCFFVFLLLSSTDSCLLLSNLTGFHLASTLTWKSLNLTYNIYYYYLFMIKSIQLGYPERCHNHCVNFKCFRLPCFFVFEAVFNFQKNLGLLPFEK